MREEHSDLASEVEWLRTLALRITGGDVHAAEDLAQETLALALERPPESPSSLRGWLARVLRSRLLLRVRADTRRRAREEDAAQLERTEEEAGAEHPLDEAERLARLRAAVEGLREPYRTAILLRYEEGLARKAIAARLRVPLRTIDTRLARGLEILRRELFTPAERRRRAAAQQRRRGEEKHGLWPLEGLAPSLFPRRRAGARAGGAAARPIALQAAVAGAVLLGAGGLVALLLVTRGAAIGEARPGGAPALPGPAVAALEAPARASDQGRAAAEPARPAEPAEPAAQTAAVARLEGLVVDLAGAPVAGAGVWLEEMVFDDRSHELRAEPFDLAGGLHRVESGPDGRFQLPFERNDVPYFLRATAGTEHTAAVLGTYVVQGTVERDRTIVLAPLVDVEGTVRDELGAPVSGARVRLRASDEVARASDRVPVNSAVFSADTRSDGSGNFRFERVPLAAGSHLDVIEIGRRPARVLLGDASGPIEVVLETDPAVLLVRGKVVDREDAPLEHAHVVGGAAAVRTDAAGEFALALDAAEPPAELAVVGPGRRAARTPTPPAGAEFVIVAGEEALALEGRVVDERGAPLVGAYVWPLDLEVLGFGRDQEPLAAEILAVGGGLEWYMNQVDEEGRFRIEGLGDRDYRLRVARAGDQCGADAGPFRAGTSDIVLRVDRAGVGIRGLVRFPDGRAVRGASLRFLVEVWRVPRPDGGEPYVERMDGGIQRTDASGSFEWPCAGAVPARLRLSTAGLMPCEVEAVGGRALEITAVRRQRLEVALDASIGGDALLFLDGDGHPLTVTVLQAIDAWHGERVPCSPGSSRVVHVPETAVLVRLEKDGEPVLERSLPPPAEETTRLELP